MKLFRESKTDLIFRILRNPVDARENPQKFHAL